MALAPSALSAVYGPAPTDRLATRPGERQTPSAPRRRDEAVVGFPGLPATPTVKG
jgi:hypothetical protein